MRVFMGVWLSWESACFACRRPGVRIPSSPPYQDVVYGYRIATHNPWVTPVNRGGGPLFCVLFQSFGLSSRNRMHQFWDAGKKTVSDDLSAAPLLIRIFFCAPLFSKVIRIIIFAPIFQKVIRIIFAIEKRRRLSCGVACNVLWLRG